MILAQVPHTLAPSTLFKDGQQMSSDAFFEEMNVGEFLLKTSMEFYSTSRNGILPTINHSKNTLKLWNYTARHI